MLATRLAGESRRHPRAVGLEDRFASLLPEVLIGIGLDQFAQLAAKALEPRPEAELSLQHIHAPRVSVREQAALVIERLRRTGAMTFRALCGDSPDTLTTVARFLSLLELFREGAVAFDQVSPLGELTVRWTGSDDADADELVHDEFDGAPPDVPSDETARREPRRGHAMTQDTLAVATTELAPSLEAVLMVADEPLDATSLATAVGYPVDDVVAALAALAEEYDAQGRGFELRNVAGGYRYYTREEYASVVEGFVLEGQQARLTQAALETLAVVAYKQPVSRARVSAIRGVNVDGVMRTLLTRGLVEEAGQDESSGATLFRTSSFFLERIGVTTIDELPGAGALPSRPGGPRRLRGGPRRRHRPAERADRAGRRHRADMTDGPAVDDDGLIRLQKLLATSGVASRRKCEELMLAGEVEVDGEVVTRLGTKVDPTTAVIRVSGQRLPPASPNVYLVLNKPRGVVSTMSDPEGRRTLGDLVADRPERLFHVGRLDTDTSGLIVLTNDGDFAQRLAHPSYEVDKTYVAEVTGEVTKATLKRLMAGVTLDDGPIAVSRARIVQHGTGKTIVELVIHEGRNRIVRRLLDHVGHPVTPADPHPIGPVRLGQLKSRASCASLTRDELGRRCWTAAAALGRGGAD